MGNAQDTPSDPPPPAEPQWLQALPRLEEDKSLSQPVVLPSGLYTNPWPTWYVCIRIDFLPMRLPVLRLAFILPHHLYKIP